MAELKIEELAEMVADTVLDKFEYEGKTIREWVEDLKKLKVPQVVRYEGDELAFCPNCNYTFELLYESWESEFHCPNCGQRLRWKE
jgi:transcription initiation factor IIE alpha subunit